MAKNFHDIRGAWQQGQFRIRFLPLGLSIVFLTSALLSRSFLWHLITLRNNTAIAWRPAVAAWFMSLLGKNIPGKVFMLVGRVFLYRNHGAPMGHVTFCFLLEVSISVLGASVLLLSGLLVFELPLDGAWSTLKPITMAAFVSLLVVMHPRILERVLSFGLRIIKRPAVTLPMRFFDVLVFCLWAALNWTLVGIGFTMLVRALVETSWQHTPYLVLSFAIASLIGFFSLFAPGGLGVREGVLLALLGQIFPLGIASVIALSARLWMTGIELGGAGLAYALIKSPLQAKIDT